MTKKKIIDKTKPPKIEIDEQLITQIADFAAGQNVKLFIVGGFVRDYFLQRPRKDFDFTIIGDSIDFARKLAVHFRSKAVIFERFRTAMVPVGGHNCEFVGTRIEEYIPASRKPKVSEGTLEDDLRRRDFTINAMAVSLARDSAYELIDLFGGIQDLKDGVLRTPLDPGITFSDDPLRMLRAARFASQLNFGIHGETLDAIKNMAQRINIISQERIADEFLKILASDKPSVGIGILYETGLLKHIFPELNQLAGVDVRQGDSRSFAHKDVLKHTLRVVDNISSVTDNLWLRFAALVHDIAKPKTKRFNEQSGWTFHGHEDLGAKWMDKIFRRMKLPLEKLDYVQRLVRLHQRPMALVDDVITDSAVRRLAVQAGDALEDLFTLCRSDITTNNPNLSSQYLNNYDIVAAKVIEIQEKDKLREFQSPVRGEEIMEICRLSPSPAVGIIKNLIEEAILEGIIPNDYDASRQYFLDNKDQWLFQINAGKVKKKRPD